MLYNGRSVYADVQEEPTAGGIQTRKKKKTKHGYTTRSNLDEDDAATNRLTRRALYDTDEEVKHLLLSLCSLLSNERIVVV